MAQWGVRYDGGEVLSVDCGLNEIAVSGMPAYDRGRAQQMLAIVNCQL